MGIFKRGQAHLTGSAALSFVSELFEGLRGLLPQQLQGTFSRLGKKSKLDWKIRAPFYQHLVDQVGNEIALEKALVHFRDRMLRTKKHAYARIILLIIQKLQNGKKFSESLEGLVGSEELAIISAGELGGKLPFALSLILEQRERSVRLKQTLRQGLSSTVGHLLIACAVLWYLASAVIPGLESAVPRAKAQGLVHFLYAISGFVNSAWIFLIPVFIGSALAALLWSLPRWTGPTRLIAERHFPYSYYRDLVGYQWLMVFATLLASGISDVQILQMQAKGASPYLSERLSLLFHRLRSGGMSLPEALISPTRQGGLSMNFPSPEINESIIALYGFANFPERITKLVTTWAAQIEARTLALANTTSKFFEYSMMFGMAILILAVQDLSNQVGTVVK